MRPAGSLPASYVEPGAEVGLKTCSIRYTHLADGSLIVLGQPAVARCSEPIAGQVNNTGGKSTQSVFWGAGCT
jgi:hypothetical protein